MRAFRYLVGFTTTTLLVALGASPAFANNPPPTAYAYVTGSVVTYVAGVGQANNVLVNANLSTVTFDDVVPIVPDAGCVTPSTGGPGRPDNTIVTCTVSTGEAMTRVYAGDGDDTVTLTSPNSALGYVDVYGGDGNDSITLTNAPDPVGDINFYGQAGNDHLTDALNGDYEVISMFGGDGDDVLQCAAPEVWWWVTMNGGAGADTMSGHCVADYSDRSTPVSVWLDNIADDGAYGEGDNVMTYVVYGGSGNDLLSSPNTAVVLDGNAGNDTLLGSPYNDTLNGGPGADTINGYGGHDDCSGGNDASDTLLNCEVIN